MNKLTTYKGFVTNGDLEEWSGGVPVGYDIDQANTTVVQLMKEQQGLHMAGQKQFEVQETLDLAPNVPIAANPLVKEGNSALRFRGAAALSAGEFAIRTAGITAAHTGAPTGQVLPMDGALDSRFTFWARGTEGSLFAVNIITQISSVPIYFAGNQTRQGTGSWTASGVDGITFAAQPIWQQYQINFQPLVYSGGFLDDGVMWEITNVASGPFTLDLDDVEYEVVDPNANQRPV